MNEFNVQKLEFSLDEPVYFNSLEEAVNYHMTETKWLDTSIGIYDGEQLAAIGYMWDVFYREPYFEQVWEE